MNSYFWPLPTHSYMLFLEYLKVFIELSEEKGSGVKLKNC